MITRYRMGLVSAALMLAVVSAAGVAAAEIGHTITIDATQPRTQVSPSLYGFS
jgi:hypothetical protein